MAATRKFYNWRTLYAGMYQRLCERMDAHNHLFPTKAESKLLGLDPESVQTFTHAYPRRIKTQERNMAIAALELFCQQKAAEINRGMTVLTNLFEANGLTLRKGKGSHCSCLLYTSPSPRDGLLSRMPSSA